MESDLTSRLQQLAATIVVPREDDGTEATLVALMPCEPAIGEVAVVVWTDSAGGELVELVRLDDGARVDDQVALREALVLLAMVETIEELASFDELEAIGGALREWSPAVGDAAALAPARERATAAVQTLAALAPADARVARTERLDELGAALRELEQAWVALEQASEAWSDALLADEQVEQSQARDVVQELWRVLGLGRRGPLARPVSTALHEAREAGTSMAAAVAGG